MSDHTAEPTRLRTLGESCPRCKRPDALSVWAYPTGLAGAWLACDHCDYDERTDD